MHHWNNIRTEIFRESSRKKGHPFGSRVSGIDDQVHTRERGGGFSRFPGAVNPSNDMSILKKIPSAQKFLVMSEKNLARKLSLSISI